LLSGEYKLDESGLVGLSEANKAIEPANATTNKVIEILNKEFIKMDSCNYA